MLQPSKFDNHLIVTLLTHFDEVMMETIHKHIFHENIVIYQNLPIPQNFLVLLV